MRDNVYDIWLYIQEALMKISYLIPFIDLFCIIHSFTDLGDIFKEYKKIKFFIIPISLLSAMVFLTNYLFNFERSDTDLYLAIATVILSVIATITVKLKENRH